MNKKALDLVKGVGMCALALTAWGSAINGHKILALFFCALVLIFDIIVHFIKEKYWDD